MNNRDILQKIAEQSDDITALKILATNKTLNDDIYYLSIFGARYPDLIKYRKEGESMKHLYLRMLETIGLLKEEFNIVYNEGNPEKILLNGKTVDTILIRASDNGNLKLVKWSLKNGADIHASDDLALRYASEIGYFEIVKYLVEQGANIHAEDDYALRYASENGHFEIVKYLVEKGANIHANNDRSLKMASRYKHLKVVKYLKEQMKNK